MEENPYESPLTLPDVVSHTPVTVRIAWEGHFIELIPIVSHKHLWMATMNELRFDGATVPTSGGFCVSDVARATVIHRGRSVLLEARTSTRPQSLVGLNYELLVDGCLLSKGVVRIQLQW